MKKTLIGLLSLVAGWCILAADTCDLNTASSPSADTTADTSTSAPLSTSAPPEPTPTLAPAPPPTQAPPLPPSSGFDHQAAKAAGASAICNDGSWSYSQHRRGTCSHHGGVNWWTGNLGPPGPG